MKDAGIGLVIWTLLAGGVAVGAYVGRATAECPPDRTQEVIRNCTKWARETSEECGRREEVGRAALSKHLQGQRDSIELLRARCWMLTPPGGDLLKRGGR